MVPYFYAEKGTPEVQSARLPHEALPCCKIPTFLYEFGVFCELLELFTLEVELRSRKFKVYSILLPLYMSISAVQRS